MDVVDAGDMRCAHCDNDEPNLIEDFRNGDYICGDCGTILEKVVDVRSEWRTFESDGNDEKNRVGATGNPLLEESGLSTMVARSGDIGLQRAQSKNIGNANEKALKFAFDEITRKIDKLQLPNFIKNKSMEIYKKVDDLKCMKARVLDGVVAACIFIACREAHLPRTLKEFSALTTVSKKDLGRYYKEILKRLDLTVDTAGTGDYMSRFCTNLKLGMDVTRACSVVADTAQNMIFVAGKSPLTVAAAAIFFVSQVSSAPRSLKKISEVTGVAEQTIRNCYKDLFQNKYTLMPEDFKLEKPLTTLPANPQ